MPVAPADTSTPVGPYIAIGDPDPVPPDRSECDVKRSPVFDLIFM